MNERAQCETTRQLNVRSCALARSVSASSYGVRLLSNEYRTQRDKAFWAVHDLSTSRSLWDKFRLKRFPPNLNRGIPMDLGMSESLGIDSLSRGLTMPKSYSADLRERVIEAVEMGASRHEAAERFDVSVSSVVKWHQYWRQTGSAAPKPRGGSVSPLEKSAARVLAVITEHPDLTLMETVAKLGRRRIHTSKSALSRFYGRHSITLKKKPASCRTAASGCGTSAQTLDTRARHA